jgi:bifunctional non-homologous end joining protein LigD
VATAGAATVVEVGGRTVSLSNLDKVLYPETGFTKAEVITYYAKIAPVLVPHLTGRAMTLKRFPNGVHTQGFFEKNCPKHRPDWIEVVDGPGDVRSCTIDEPATLVWTANMAAIELHAPLSLAVDLDAPRTVMFDLDPGEPATIMECCQVALLIRDLLDHLGLQAWCKTSGSKGLQMVVPLNPPDGEPADYEATSTFALAVGQMLERQHPKLVLTTMTRAMRPGKVFVDWSQNNRHKTTIAVYSMRARPRPTVSTPVTWDEVADCAAGRDPLTFEANDVIARVDTHGDLFSDVLTVRQALPA